jgi:hypothetical protein
MIHGIVRITLDEHGLGLGRRRNRVDDRCDHRPRVQLMKGEIVRSQERGERRGRLTQDESISPISESTFFADVSATLPDPRREGSSAAATRDPQHAVDYLRPLQQATDASE